MRLKEEKDGWREEGERKESEERGRRGRGRRVKREGGRRIRGCWRKGGCSSWRRWLKR